MAIITVLIALAVPAVMRAREASNRATCLNNLRQLGVAFHSYHEQNNYFPTAGFSDFSAPFYGTAPPSYPLAARQQDAGWGFQVLPYLGSESVWLGGSPTNNNIQKMQAALSTPLKVFVCPSRRSPTRLSYTNPAFPSQGVYNSVRGQAFTVAPCDYAACNGNAPPGSALGTPGSGIVLSQLNGRKTVQLSDILDGAAYTLLLGEKAANNRRGPILNEDDMGYAAAFSAANFNTIRFTAASLLPLRDDDVNGPTGGAFGSAHSGTFNALMADGSVQQLSYNIDPAIYSGLGTIRGREIISDADLIP